MKFYAVLSANSKPLPFRRIDNETFVATGNNVPRPDETVVVYAADDEAALAAADGVTVLLGAEPAVANRVLGAVSAETRAFASPLKLGAAESKWLAEQGDEAYLNLHLKLADVVHKAVAATPEAAVALKAPEAMDVDDVVVPATPLFREDDEVSHVDEPETVSSQAVASQAVASPVLFNAPPATQQAASGKTAVAKGKGKAKAAASKVGKKAGAGKRKTTARKAAAPKTPEAKPTSKKAASKTSPKNVTDVDGNIPRARWGHSAAFEQGVDGGASQIVIFGGNGYDETYNDTWRLDWEKETWEQVPTTGETPDGRMGHTATMMNDRRQMYVFGGSKGQRWMNDMHQLNMDTNEWSLVSYQGEVPKVAYHSATLVGKELFVFGGTLPNNNCSNKLYIFDTERMAWYEAPTEGAAPAPRSGHSACLVDNKLYIIGGWDAPECFNDVHVLDIGQMKWSKLETSGEAPKARTWLAAHPVADNKILLFGGYDGNASLNDLHVLDLSTNAWVNLDDVLDVGLFARAGHSMTATGDRLVIFGGGNNDGGWFNDWPSITVDTEEAK